ncbi:MAG: phosphate ABC transporter permease family protein, partial [Phenylobacterium sp.]|nr:phosphate ABC transporter permease family protein [Phenylobacterium sp.]
MLTWTALLALFLFSGATYAFGRRKAQALAATGKPGALHSLPGYHGGYVALWAGLPAALIVLIAAVFGGRMEAALLRADPPAAVQALTAHGQAVFFDDARAMAHGTQASETIYEGDLETAIQDKAIQARRLEQLIQYGALAAGVVVGLAGLAIAYPRISPTFRARNRVEGWIAVLFIACAVTAILTTVGIVGSLVWESWRFFQSVPPL